MQQRMERMKEIDKRASARNRRLWLVTAVIAVLITAWQIYSATHTAGLKPLVARVVRQDGTPLAGVRIQFIGETATDETPAYVATTGADGTVPLPADIHDDGYYLLARDADGVLSQSFGQRGLANEIVIEPASRIRGTVSSDLGLPLEGATILVRFGNERAPVLVSAVSDKDGKFQIDDVSRSLDFLYVEAKKAGYAPVSIEYERSNEPIAFELQSELDLRIRVFLPNGQPAADLPVCLEAVANSETHTDREGRAVFTGLRRDLSYSVMIAETRLTYVRELLQPSDQAHRIDLCQPATIYGHVVDQQGLPLAGVEVRHGQGPRRWVRTKTDENGAFRLGDVPAGRIVIFYETGGKVGNTLVHVQPGQDVHGIVIRVEPE